MTSLGSALKRLFNKNNITYISFNGINDLDFSTNESHRILDTINIKEAIVTYHPPLIHHTKSDGIEYLNQLSLNYINGLTSYFKTKKINFVFAANQPIPSQVAAKVIQNGGSVYEIPHIVDSKALYDLENPIMRTLLECKKVGYAYVESPTSLLYHSVTSDEVAELIYEQLQRHFKAHIAIRGSKQTKAETAIKTALEAANISNCSINFANSSHKPYYPYYFHWVEVLGKTASAEKIIKNEFEDFKAVTDSDVYLSIVVTNRNHGYYSGSEARVENFLKSIDYGLQRMPLANIELIVVDYSNNNNKLLSDNIKIPNHLQGKVRFIKVPATTHQALESRFNVKQAFFEYVARNIGIRRSRGKFILTTNTNCIFSTEFFELIASRQLNPGIVYQSKQLNIKKDANYSIDELITELPEIWTLNKMNIFDHPEYEDKISIIQSCDDLNNKTHHTLNNFHLLSRDLWYAIQGYNEIPYNNVNSKVFMSRIMKLVNGYVRMYMQPMILYQTDDEGIEEMQNEREIINEYCCDGKCKSCGPYYDSDNWGMAGQEFEEILK
ncbi:hypothetical protein GPJ56_005868 [Histomonas meleagridis]|uniref:uncharacterized protein n=1 Tax=Histomonas meleagridis TaxID=135588 RepID=UPI003559D85B|nr:hypothetical protein GPJ56_005868 [Histomonas meleagridis]KAH0798597.1 hypothetical protein GO595_008462 [Histomonas meleagridis]